MTWRMLVTCRQMQVSMHLFEDRLRKLDVEWDCPAIPGQQFSADHLIPIIGSYDVIIAGDDEISAAVLEAARPRLRAVAKWGIGVDGIDLVAARELGIEVTNTPGMFDDEVADVAHGYILSLLRGLHQIDRAVRGGEWPKVEGRSTRGLTLGVVGLGGTGRALTARAAAAGMVVIGSDVAPAAVQRATDEGVTVVPFEDLLQTSDVVSLHCPLTPATTGLLSAGAFAQMKPGAFVVNTSRGRVIDEAALVTAIESGHLAGAALDVFETEPLPADSPLRELDNVILGSHNASNTREAVVRTSEEALGNALASLGLT